MDFGKINTSTITTPASAMSMDKPIYFGGTAGTSGTSGAIRGGTTGFVEFKNTTNDWKELNANYNAGVYTTPSVSVSATGGVLTIGEGVFNLHADPYGGDVVKTYTISGGTLTIPDSGSTSYVYADYNDGSPIYAYTSDESTLTENQYVELMMYGDDTSNRIVANTASSGPPARPASPSIIATVNKIA